MPKSNFLRKKSKTGATADFKRLKAKVGFSLPTKQQTADSFEPAARLLPTPPRWHRLSICAQPIASRRLSLLSRPMARVPPK